MIFFDVEIFFAVWEEGITHGRTFKMGQYTASQR